MQPPTKIGRDVFSKRGRVAGLVAVLLLVAVACGGSPEPAPSVAGDRVTISIGVRDDPGHRAALYALDERIVISSTIDLVISYLPPSEIEAAGRSSRFDVVEVGALEVPLGMADDFELVVLSAGLQSLGGTILFVERDAELTTPSDLAGKTFGVVDRDDASTLETRFLLWNNYGVDTSLGGEDVKIEEAPASSLLTLLESGDVDAAVLTDISAYRLLDDAEFRVLGEVTSELRELTGVPVMQSILVSYPSVTARKVDALSEVSRLLAESVTYFRANQDAVIEAVAADQQVEVEFLDWWWTKYDLPLGDLSEGTQEQLLQVWEAARTLGDLESYPELADALFDPTTVTPPPE